MDEMFVMHPLLNPYQYFVVQCGTQTYPNFQSCCRHAKWSMNCIMRGRGGGNHGVLLKASIFFYLRVASVQESWGGLGSKDVKLVY